MTKEIHITPNPVGRGDELIIHMQKNGFNRRNLSVYYYTGTEVISDSTHRNKVKITAPEQPGLYFVVIYDQDLVKTSTFAVY